MELVKIDYRDKDNEYSIEVKELRTEIEKKLGLMFRKDSPPLLFIYDYEQDIKIHSFFCKPFTAIWLDENMNVTKEEHIFDKRHYLGYGKYLLEIPIKTKTI